MTAPRRVWSWLGTAASVRVITVGMVVYALAIAGLVAGYARVSACIAEYSNTAARATSERTIAADEDRNAQRAMAEALAGARSLDDVRGAAAKVVASIDDNNLRRAQNPPPRPPDEQC